MSWITGILSFLGIGTGAAILIAFLAPAFLPGIVVSVATSIANALLKALSWFLSTFLNGAQHIAASPAAILTVAVCIIVSSLFSWHPVANRGKEPSRVERGDPIRSSKTKSKLPIDAVGDYISCALNPSCW